MARIGILSCSNATQELGCSSVSCLADLRKRTGTFADYAADEPLVLVGIINCPGCPTPLQVPINYSGVSEPSPNSGWMRYISPIA